MKNPTTRSVILLFSSSFITFGSAYSADHGAPLSEVHAWTHAGHGIGSALSIRVNQQADIYAFLFDRLGMHMPQK